MRIWVALGAAQNSRAEFLYKEGVLCTSTFHSEWEVLCSGTDIRINSQAESSKVYVYRYRFRVVVTPADAASG